MPDLLPRVQITAANRRFHFSLMAEWRFSRGVQEQTEAFLGGFNEVVPLQWLQYFDEKELEVRPSPRAAGGGGVPAPSPVTPPRVQRAAVPWATATVWRKVTSR